MKRLAYIIVIGCHLLIGTMGYAQEIEESADVFLEEYSDEFQENFFEALKQKGIENHDKAINLLLECKRIDPNNTVVDHELAKVYLAIKEYVSAQEYAIATVNSSPENLWYLHTLVKIVQRQGNTITALQHTIPYKNIKFRENLALIYYKARNYEEAETILKGINRSSYTIALSQKIIDAKELSANARKNRADGAKKMQVTPPLEMFKTKLAALIVENDFAAVEKISTEALESFPLQPYFYYANGLSYNKNANYQRAIEILESGLDYLLDEDVLSKNIYRELAVAYTALGNTSKANMYLSKIKK